MEREQDKNQAPKEKELAREGAKNRREMDEVPPPGTDPLHEGP